MTTDKQLLIEEWIDGHVFSALDGRLFGSTYIADAKAWARLIMLAESSETADEREEYLGQAERLERLWGEPTLTEAARRRLDRCSAAC